jgi:hypothetical protein
MPARWLQAKVIKLKKERRAWARKYSIPSGIQANREVVRQYQDTVKGLGKEIGEVRFPNVAAGRHELMLRYQTPGDPLRGIIEDIRDPMFVKLVDNSRQRCRVYFNSGMTVFILQWVDWRKRVVRLSRPFASSTEAIDAWYIVKENDPIWKKEFPLRKG